MADREDEDRKGREPRLDRRDGEGRPGVDGDSSAFGDSGKQRGLFADRPDEAARPADRPVDRPVDRGDGQAPRLREPRLSRPPSFSGSIAGIPHRPAAAPNATGNTEPPRKPVSNNPDPHPGGRFQDLPEPPKPRLPESDLGAQETHRQAAQTPRREDIQSTRGQPQSDRLAPPQSERPAPPQSERPAPPEPRRAATEAPRGDLPPREDRRPLAQDLDPTRPSRPLEKPRTAEAPPRPVSSERDAPHRDAPPRDSAREAARAANPIPMKPKAVQAPAAESAHATPRKPVLVTKNEGLVVHSLGKQFKKRPVLRDVSLRVQRGEAVGLLGPNGAGKTTCFYIVTGLIPTDYGQIMLDGVDITELPMYRRSRLGIGYLPQESSIFRGLTVEQNIMAVLELIEKNREKREVTLEALLAEFSITHLRRTPAIALSGGERRRLEIARALASQPNFVLLDEPLAGIDPIAVRDIRGLVSHLKDRGIGVLITDHNVRETLDIVDRAYILHDGNVLMEGTPDEIVANQEVRRVYLGDKFSL